MLEMETIRKEPGKVKRSVKRRGLEVDVDRILELDEKRRELIPRVESFRAEINRISEGGGKPSQKQIERARKIKKKLNEAEPQLEKVEKELEQLLLSLPNLIHPDVPDGKDEKGNVVVRRWGEPRSFDFEPKDHLEIGERLDIIDTSSSARVSGSRFNYLKDEAVLLQFALVNFVFDTVCNKKVLKKIAEKNGVQPKPFVAVVPPMMMRAEVMQKMGRLEPIEERYYLPRDEMVLVGSAEHTLGPMHMDEVLDLSQLPIRYVGYSTSFRREAGSYGKDTRGILRVHQFDKLEMETFTTEENSEAEQEFLIGIQEHLMQKLDLPYQVVMICTGDMGAPDYRQVDIEAWLPGQDKYRETHTADLVTDFQSRRLNTRYKDESGELRYAHMNDATAFAIGRTLIAILENYQQKDGSVEVPKVLRRYSGLKKIQRR